MIALPARSDLLKTLRRLGWLFVAGWLVRSLLVGMVRVPDGAMLPQLRAGDTVLVAKWPYGWSRHGLFGGAPLFDGRIGAATPARGDVVTVRVGDRTLVRRVIGLPRDAIAIRHGAVRLDGHALPRLRIGDLVLTRCDGCRDRRFVETLPDGRSHAVLGMANDMAERRVDVDQLFLLPDHRGERSGMIAADRLLGRATLVIWSTDGTARWSSPRSWWRTIRWARVGLGVA